MPGTEYLLSNPGNNSKRLVLLSPFFTGMVWARLSEILIMILTSVSFHSALKIHDHTLTHIWRARSRYGGCFRSGFLEPNSEMSIYMWRFHWWGLLGSTYRVEWTKHTRRWEKLDCSAVTTKAPGDRTGPTALSWIGARTFVSPNWPAIEGTLPPWSREENLEWGSSP